MYMQPFAAGTALTSLTVLYSLISIEEAEGECMQLQRPSNGDFTIFLALAGLPGAGKTAQLQHLHHTLLQGTCRQPASAPAGIIQESMQGDIPLLFYLNLRKAASGSGGLPNPELTSRDHAAAALLTASFLPHWSSSELQCHIPLSS